MTNSTGLAVGDRPFAGWLQPGILTGGTWITYLLLALPFVWPEPAAAQQVVGGQCGKCGKWYIGTHNCPYDRGGGGGGGGGGGSGGGGWTGTPRWRLAALDCNRLGLNAYNQENWDHAVYYFELANSHDPNDAVMRKNLQNARDQQRWAREKAQRNETIRRYHDQAKAAENRGDYKAAEWYLQQAHDQYPFESSVTHELIEMGRKRKEADRKAEEMRQALAMALKLQQEEEVKRRAEEHAQDMARQAKTAANRGD